MGTMGEDGHLQHGRRAHECDVHVRTLACNCLVRSSTSVSFRRFLRTACMRVHGNVSRRGSSGLSLMCSVVHAGSELPAIVIRSLADPAAHPGRVPWSHIEDATVQIFRDDGNTLYPLQLGNGDLIQHSMHCASRTMVSCAKNGSDASSNVCVGAEVNDLDFEGDVRTYGSHGRGNMTSSCVLYIHTLRNGARAVIPLPCCVLRNTLSSVDCEDQDTVVIPKGAELSLQYGKVGAHWLCVHWLCCTCVHWLCLDCVLVVTFVWFAHFVTNVISGVYCM